MTFRNHYTLEEARAMLPQVRLWLQKLEESRGEFELRENRLAMLRAEGNDLGGPPVDEWLRKLAAIQDTLALFRDADIQVKDLDRGLVDFPSIRDGKEVFLCWEKCEDDIEFWHDLEAGYAGRKHL